MRYGKRDSLLEEIKDSSQEKSSESDTWVVRQIANLSVKEWTSSGTLPGKQYDSVSVYNSFLTDARKLIGVRCFVI